MGRLTELAHYRRLKLHSQGLTDIEMANIENVVPASIRMWRKKHGLPSNAKKYETTEKERKIVNSFMTDMVNVKKVADRHSIKINSEIFSDLMATWVLL